MRSYNSKHTHTSVWQLVNSPCCCRSNRTCSPHLTSTCAYMITFYLQFYCALPQCFQALVHHQSNSKCRGSKNFNCIPFKTMKESTCALHLDEAVNEMVCVRLGCMVTYFSVFKLWFILRVSASAAAPESSIVFHPRL